jgi:D-xylose transport system permease protein
LIYLWWWLDSLQLLQCTQQAPKTEGACSQTYYRVRIHELNSRFAIRHGLRSHSRPLGFSFPVMPSRLTLRDFSLLIALTAVCGFFAIVAPQFLGARNLSLLMTELAITATLAMGMLLVILPGHIDLSAGSGVGLFGGVASVLVFQHAVPAPLALFIGLVLGVLVWNLMGRIIVQEHVPAFITTLAGLLVLRGVFWKVINNSTIPVAPGGTTNLYSMLTTTYLPSWLGYALATVVSVVLGLAALRHRQNRRHYGFPVEQGEAAFMHWFIAAQAVFLFVIITNQFRGVPLPALILGGVALLVHFLTQHTAFGRYLYAIGGNEEAATISGVPVQRVVITAYSLMGAIVATCGFMQTAYAGASTTTVGEQMELDAVAACVIGGASLKGGRGTVVGVLMGALLIACLLNGMTLLAVGPENKFIARGLVLLLAVWVDQRMAK